MCGLAGYFGAEALSPGERSLRLRAMTGILAHRGPDGEGFAEGKGFGLGHRRLAIIDLQTGQQPMTSSEGRGLIAFNGEIYNYVELRAGLEGRGRRFRTTSDTEVLLEHLSARGPEGLPELNGMYALAFVEPSTGEWLLARDPFGIKPLYFAQAGEALVFASEIKALLAWPGLARGADPEALQDYMTFQFSLGEATLFKGVRKLEPGTYARGRGTRIREVRRFADPSFRVDDHHSPEYFVDSLRGLLEDATRLQVRSDVPVGAYLSGGMDSSGVGILAARHLGRPIKFFHGTFREGPAYDESAFARSVAEKAGGELLTVTPGPRDFVEDLPGLMEAMDEPVAGPGLFPQYRVSRLAAGHVKVVLGGQGGDEIFGGYARYLIGYLEQALKGAVFETQEEGRHIVSLASMIPHLPLLKTYGPLMQRFWSEGLFSDMDRRYFRLIDRSPDLERILTPEALAGFDKAAVFERFRSVFNHPDTRSYIKKMTHFDMKTLLPALLQVEDRVSMAVSIESRVPLLDPRIVDLAASMPPAYEFGAGRTKNMLKKALEGLVPEPVVRRKDKMGFPVPLTEWLAGGPVRDFCGDVLLSPASRKRGLFRPGALEGLIRKEAPFGRQLWGALCLELWHRRFIDPR